MIAPARGAGGDTFTRTSLQRSRCTAYVLKSGNFDIDADGMHTVLRTFELPHGIVDVSFCSIGDDDFHAGIDTGFGDSEANAAAYRRWRLE